jgi:hypothetical protein
LAEPHFSLAWLELAAPVAAGCLWAAMFVIALREPRRLFFWQEKNAHG